MVVVYLTKSVALLETIDGPLSLRLSQAQACANFVPDITREPSYVLVLNLTQSLDLIWYILLLELYFTVIIYSHVRSNLFIFKYIMFYPF